MILPCRQVDRQGPLAGIIPSHFTPSTLTPAVVSDLLADDKKLGEVRLLANANLMAHPPALEVDDMLGYLVRLKVSRGLSLQADRAPCVCWQSCAGGGS